jgi:hypothetical protein
MEPAPCGNSKSGCPSPNVRKNLLGANEAGAALALPGKAELIVWPVFVRVLVFAAAAGRAADVVLLADTAGMERPQIEELALELLNAPLDLCGSHDTDSNMLAIGTCQQKNAVRTRTSNENGRMFLMLAQ